MIRWTGLAPWEFEFPFGGSLTSTFREELPPTATGRSNRTIPKGGGFARTGANQGRLHGRASDSDAILGQILSQNSKI